MLRHPLIVSTVLCLSYGIIFVCGVTGNSFLILTLFKNPSLRTTTNVLIGNLAVADLLVSIFCVPFTLASNLQKEWIFGEGLCKFVGYFEEVVMNASILNLMAISIDRCLSINRPFGFMKRKKKLIVIVTLIWIFPSLYMIPWLIVFHAKSIDGNIKHTICSDFWENKRNSDAYFILVNLFLSYLLPLAIISICYILIYKKISSRHIPGEMCPVQLFALSWFPLYTLIVVIKYLGYPNTREQLNHFEILYPLAQWLATSNACINPIIYTFYSKNFRNHFLKFFKSMHLLSEVKKETNDICSANKECILLSSTQIT